MDTMLQKFSDLGELCFFLGDMNLDISKRSPISKNYLIIVNRIGFS